MIITTENQLKDYFERLRQKNIRKIALDMEGDQGMFHYHYSISIIQCFDGVEAVVIDVLKMGCNDTLREFLTCRDVTKIMFSCGNDIFMAQNVLGCTIAPINDIAVAQKLLGLPINLASYLGIDKVQKDGFQRANWLIRPIKPALLEYAVNDVLKLLDIESGFAAQLEEKGLYDDYIVSSRAASDRCYAVDPHTLFATKFPGYARLSPEKKRLAAALWIFRELLGEKFDCPVGYIMPKKELAAILGNSGGNNLAAALEREINRNRKPHKRLSGKLIQELFEKAAASPHIPALKSKHGRGTRKPAP